MYLLKIHFHEFFSSKLIPESQNPPFFSQLAQIYISIKNREHVFWTLQSQVVDMGWIEVSVNPGHRGMLSPGEWIKLIKDLPQVKQHVRNWKKGILALSKWQLKVNTIFASALLRFSDKDNSLSLLFKFLHLLRGDWLVYCCH